MAISVLHRPDSFVIDTAPLGALPPAHASTVTVRRRGQRVVLRLRGGLTDASREHLAEALSWANRLGAREVLVDLGGVEVVDAACLRVLRATRAVLCRRGGRLTVTVVRPEVRLTLGLTGLGAPVLMSQRADGSVQSGGSRR